MFFENLIKSGMGIIQYEEDSLLYSCDTNFTTDYAKIIIHSNQHSKISGRNKAEQNSHSKRVC